MPQLQKKIKHFVKKTTKNAIGSSLKLTNNILAAIKKKRGLILIEFMPDAKSRYSVDSPHPMLMENIKSREDNYKQTIEQFLKFADSFSEISIEKPLNPSKPNFDNYFFSGLDAFSLYGILGTYKPATYIEIGSGFSTKFARQAISDFNLKTQLISIDPYPRTEIDSLCDQVIREPIENTDLTILKNLQAGDILFIDSSHYTLQNSDVTVLFMEVLPYLNPGVLVHVHDIYLPWDYPPHWVERNYSEQYLLAMQLLVRNPDFTVIFPSYYLSQKMECKSLFQHEFNQKRNKSFKCQGTSFWLQVKEK